MVPLTLYNITNEYKPLLVYKYYQLLKVFLVNLTSLSLITYNINLRQLFRMFNLIDLNKTNILIYFWISKYNQFLILNT